MTDDGKLERLEMRTALMAAECTMSLVRKFVNQAYALDRFDETLAIVRAALNGKPLPVPGRAP